MFDTTPLLLHRRDPARNMARFYRLSMEPNLFGGISLVRNWGRIGDGLLRIDLHSSRADAAAAWRAIAAAKRCHGYTDPT